MIKSIAQVIPSYCISYFLNPKTLYEDIERLIDISNLYNFNLVLFGKHYRKFIQNPNSFVSRVFKARYFPRDHFIKPSLGNGSSFIWSGISKAREALLEGFRWVLNDGDDINIFLILC